MLLEQTRVVDLSDGVAGAYATRLMASLGADVVKVEPPGGDPTRHRGPRVGDTPDGSVLFAYLNTGKRGVVLDADRADDRAALERLIEAADVVVESGAPGAWRDRGIDLDAIAARRPALVVCSVTPFGQDGPRAGWRATALTAFASGGQMNLCGDPDRPPLKTAGDQAGYQTGLHVFSACLTALFGARCSGVGDHLDISIQEAQASALEGFGPSAMVNEVDAARTGNQMFALWGIYPCADGHVGVASMARQAKSVFECIGQHELGETLDLPGMVADPSMNDLVTALVTEWTSARTSEEIFEASQRARAPFSLIPSPGDLLEWPPLRERGFWQEVEHPVLGRHALPGRAFSVDRPPLPVRRSPLLGEHTAEVLAELDAASSAADPPAAPDGPPPLPLAGVRVLDLTQVWAGPFATRFLGDMGADVIHIEGTTFPDAVRAIGPADGERTFDRSPYFNEYNRSKRGLALDLQQPDGLAAFRALVAQSDVVIENWSADVATRLGVSCEELRRVNPRISMLQMPGFSQEPPESERVGFGPTIEQMGGLVALQGYAGGPPHKSGISYGDPTAGTLAAGAVALALLHRERTGEGLHMVLRQRDNIIGLIGEFIVAESIGAEYPARIGNRDVDCAPHGVYRAADGTPRPLGSATGTVMGETSEEWLAIAVEDDAAWAALRGAIGDARLDDARYAARDGRRADEDAIDAVIAEWVRAQDAGDAAARLQAAGVSAVPVLSPLMLVRDAHLAARGFYTTYDHPVAGRQRTTHPVWRLRRRALLPLRAAPGFGEHNAEVLREVAGYADAQIEALGAAHVIASTPLAD